MNGSQESDTSDEPPEKRSRLTFDKGDLEMDNIEGENSVKPKRYGNFKMCANFIREIARYLGTALRVSRCGLQKCIGLMDIILKLMDVEMVEYVFCKIIEFF